MCDQCANNCLPKPRLVLRLGGMGNIRLGRDNGIAEDGASIAAAAGVAVRQVLARVEQVLAGLHEAEREKYLAPMVNEGRYRVVAAVSGIVFGWADPWRRLSDAGSNVGVFSGDRPLVQVLTGDELGGDIIIKEAALSRDEAGALAEFAHVRVTPEAPGAVPGGIGVGKIPDPNGPASGPVVDRVEARQRAKVSKERAAGFRAQSEALRHHSDLLVAVWDPDTEGKIGGTSESVLAALRERIPVVAIRVVGQNAVSIAVLQSPEELDGAAKGDWEGQLGDLLVRLLRFPDPVEKNHGLETSYDPRAVFAFFRSGRELKSLWPGKVWTFGKPARGARKEEVKDEYWEWYGKYRARASSDGMSGTFGDAHRGGIVLAYLLGAAAIALAVVGGLVHHYEGPVWVVGVIALAEIVVIAVMWALSTCSRVDDWDEAYTDSRMLAEALRMMKPLAPLGVHTPIPRLPHYLSGDQSRLSPEHTWAAWYFRALVRMAPLRLPHEHIGDLKKYKEEVIQPWLEGQKHHHEKNMVKQDNTHKAVEKWSPYVFVFVVAFAVLHFVEIMAHTHFLFAPTLVVCIAGPAFLSAVHGLVSQLEVSRLQRSSKSMANLLKQRIEQLAGIDHSRPEGPAEVWGMAAESLKSASVMMDETASWSALYKNIDIPAA